jgi:succinoglycan biosynthesis protein ExoA
MNEEPLVSVVMPVRNEGGRIERSVLSVLDQDYPADRLEVIAVVGTSTDDTRDVLQRIAAGDSRLRILDNPDGRTPVGLNLGVRAARGEYIARVDGHAWVDRDFISSGMETIRRTGCDGVGGVTRHEGEGPIGSAIALAMTSRLGVGNSFRVVGAEREVDTFAFPLYRREVFERVGLFDEDLLRNQDDELNHRIRRAGGRLVFAPTMGSSYLVRSSVSALWSQYWQYGRFRFATVAKHRRPGAARQLAPPALVSGLAAGLALDAASGGGWYAGRVLAACYALLLLAGGLVAATSARRPLLAPLVAVACGAMHLSYGAGFWTELGARVLRLARVPRRARKDAPAGLGTDW